MTLGYSNQIWCGWRGLVLQTCKRDSWVWDMEDIRVGVESFFELVYVTGVGHCIRFWQDPWSGHTPLKVIFKRSLVKLKKKKNAWQPLGV